MKGALLLVGSLLLALPAFAMDAPDSVEIDILADLFQGVEFDHQMHVDLAQDCSVCHHHTTGTGTVDLYCARCHDSFEEQANVACQNCHLADPFSAAAIQAKGETNLFHVDVNGLKGAYHRNCMGCHEQMDGPTGCQDCHARTEAGDAFYHSGKFAPPASAQVESEH
jgi:hypothetical protein